MRRWLIVGHYGGANTGDEAMLLSLLQGLGEDRCQGSIVVTKNGQVPVFAHGFGVKAIAPRLISLLAALRQMDGMILGGGTHFHDDYSQKRLLRHYRYMARIVALSWLARLLGKRVVWLSMGFGPYYGPISKWMTQLGLLACHCVTVRESASLLEVQRLGASKKLLLTFDLAALLKRESENVETVDQRTKEEDRCILGISVTSVASSRNGSPERDVEIIEKLATSLNASLDLYDKLNIHVIVFRGGNREDDFALSQQLLGLIDAKHSARVNLVPYDDDPAVMLQEVSRCHAFLATRFHAGVLAYLSECRLVFLAYHRKLNDLAEEILLPADHCIDLSDSSISETLPNAITRLVMADPTCRPALSVSEAMKRSWKNVEAVSL